jgi:L-threonylcarbamoyladenylate synthase
VARVFAVKGRPVGHPLIVHLASADLLDEWAVEIPAAARALAQACWPGPLTLILRRSSRVVDEVTGGRPTVGLRVPDHPLAHALLTAFGGGVAAPSANRFGHVSPTTAAHVRADLGADVDLVLDGGPSQVGVESTIIDLSGDRPEVLRPGAIGVGRLTQVLGVAPAVWAGTDGARAPGMLRGHYAPAARVEIVGGSEVAARAHHLLSTSGASTLQVGVLAPTVVDDLPPGVIELEPVGGPEDHARLLYDRLRQADRLGIQILLAVPPGDGGTAAGVAVLDRLRRAAASSHP